MRALSEGAARTIIWTWRGHSCLPRRDSSRRISELHALFIRGRGPRRKVSTRMSRGVAVGTAVTRCPPHSPGCWRYSRTRFLPWMFGVEALRKISTSRTRSSPLDPLSRLCVRRWLDWPVFSLASGLSSTTSADGLPPLFGWLRRYYAAVRLSAAVHEGLTAHRVLPPARAAYCLRAAATGSPRVSRLEFLCVRGVFDSAGPRRTRDSVRLVVAFLTV